MDPVVPEACVEAARDAWVDECAKFLATTDREVVRAALAAALSVRDEHGIPELVKPWLEQVGWDNGWLHRMNEPFYHGDCVPVFRLRGDTE